MEKTAKFRVILNDYPESFIISKKRAIKYWKPKNLLPIYLETLEKTGKLIWKEKSKAFGLALYDPEKKEFVVKNKKVAGTERFHTINSQNLWVAGGGSQWTRLATEKFLKSWFTPAIIRQLPEKIWMKDDEFIHFEYIFFYPFNPANPNDNRLWRQYQDYINHCFIRAKIFEDTLTELGVIPDDSPMYVRGSYMRYVAIPPDQERHMDVVIHFCKNNQTIIS